MVCIMSGLLVVNSAYKTRLLPRVGDSRGADCFADIDLVLRLFDSGVPSV